MTTDSRLPILGKDMFAEIECYLCFEPIDESKNGYMVVSYVHNQYAHTRCYWQDRLNKFIPLKDLQDLLARLRDADNKIDLFNLIVKSLNEIIPADIQEQVVSDYNKRFIEYCNKMKDLK